MWVDNVYVDIDVENDECVEGVQSVDEGRRHL